MTSKSRLSLSRFGRVARVALGLVFNGTLMAGLPVSLLAGCGSSFSPSAQLACGTNCANNGASGTDTAPNPSHPPAGGAPTTSEEWKNLKVQGTVSEGWAKDTLSVELDKANKELIVRLPMLAIPYLVGMPEIQIPQLPGARLTFEILATERPALALRIPLSQYLKGITFAPPTRLPNGDPLPGVPDGELPSLAVQLVKARDIKATIYLSPAVVGIYVNTPLNPYVDLIVPIRNELRQILGYVSTVSAKNSFEGGFFISVKLPSEIVRIIDDNI